MEKKKYDGVAMTLHWLMALSITVALILAPNIGDLPLAERKAELAAHSFNGLFAITLAVIRLWWRIKNPPPPYPDTMPEWQQKMAKGVTQGFYFMFFYMPLIGIGYAMTYQATEVEPLGLFNLSIAPSDAVEIFATLHWLGMIAFFTLLALHVGAALKHLIIDRDKIMQRMLPFTKVE